MTFHPMPGDVEPLTDPSVVTLAEIIEEPFQGDDPSGPADDPAMQPDGHHFRPAAAFTRQPLEGVGPVLRRLAGG